MDVVVCFTPFWVYVDGCVSHHFGCTWTWCVSHHFRCTWMGVFLTIFGVHGRRVFHTIMGVHGRCVFHTIWGMTGPLYRMTGLSPIKMNLRNQKMVLYEHQI